MITLAMCALLASPTLAQNDNGEAEALRRIKDAAVNEATDLDLRGLCLTTLPP
jgi:hypothetical protein